MKIFLCTLLPFEPSRFGGGYQALHPLIECFSAYKVFSIFHLGEPASYSESNLTFLKLRNGETLKSWVAAQVRLFFHFLRFRPNIVIVSPDRASVGFAVIFGRLFGAKVCLWVMDDLLMVPTLPGFERIWRRAGRYVLLGIYWRMATWRMCASSFLGDLLEKRYRKKANQIVSKGLDKVYPQPNNEQTKYRPIKLVYAGSPSSEFYLEPIFKIAQIIDQEFPGIFSLNLFGPGDFPASLSKFNCVQSIGTLPSDNTVEPLINFDYAILPYSFNPEVIQFFRDSFPSKLVAYLGAGLPTISIMPTGIRVANALRIRNIGPIIHNDSNEEIISLLSQVLATSHDQWLCFSRNASNWAFTEFMFDPKKIFEQLTREKTYPKF